MPWLVFVLGIATFLVAAKAHGRQLRLERELAGHWHVTFGGQNPAFVDALWRRERVLFWSTAAALALLTIGVRVLARRLELPPSLTGPGARSVVGGLVLHVLVPMIGAFVVTGLYSIVRFALAARDGSVPNAGRTEEWMSGAVWGTAGWWVLTVALSAVLFWLAWRRPV